MSKKIVHRGPWPSSDAAPQIQIQVPAAESPATAGHLLLALEGGDLGLYKVEMVAGHPVLTVDDRYLSQIGLTRADGDFTLARWFELMHPDDREKMQRAIADFDAGLRESVDSEYRLRHATGGWRWILDRSRVFARDAEGNVLLAAGAHIDITARKAAEQALEDLNRTLEARVDERTAEVSQQADQLRALASQLSRTEQRERKRLAALLHDHIQQYLVAAQMQLKWIARDADPTRFQAAVAGAADALDQAIHASRSLALELSPPALSECGLAAGLNVLVARMRERHRLAVDFRADADAEPADDDARFLLYECARELLLNVVKHAQVERAEMVLVRIAGKDIRLIVSDDGNGFEPSRLTCLQPETMSFGLFGVRERLAHLGGMTLLESAPGRGTRVTLVLPDAVGIAAARDTDQAANVAAARTFVARRRQHACRVLVVDDHPIVREGLAGLLETEPDIEIIDEASSGEQAVQLAAELRPDVIVMDINLGAGMDGIDATRRVLAASPDIKVICLSMYGDRDIVAAMLEAGAAAFIKKGGPPEELIAAIRRCYEASEDTEPSIRSGSARAAGSAGETD